jgi:prepilin-type N-terminal cleavage/methylation domain-containing protein
MWKSQPLKTKNNVPSHISSRGYTLVELSVVLLIAGLFVASGLQVLKIYRVDKAMRTTDVTMTSLMLGLQQYLEANGHYPCVAPLDAARGTAGYGLPTDCDDTSVAVGTCADGICVEESVNTVDVGGTPTYVRVRRGAVPFRVLNRSEDKAYDGLGHRIEYVVTERLASPTLLGEFDPEDGGITVLTAGATPPTPALPGMTHMLLISRGTNGAAAYSYDGVQTSPCPATGVERENCNTANTVPENQAIYVSGVHNLEESNYFDDIISYRAAVNRPLWKATDLSKTDITDLVVAGGGVGAAGDINPGYVPKLDALGAQGDIRAQGEFHLSGLLCDRNGLGCFSPDKIGGAGMACPNPGEVMIGIQDGQPLCVAATSNSCPPGQFITGIDANRRPICDDPPNSCGDQNINVCGDSPYTLPANFQGTTLGWFYGGDARREKWRCQSSGSWTRVSSQGSCTCSACTPNTWTVDGECPDGTVGDVSEDRQRWCKMSGTWPPPPPYDNVSSTTCSRTETIASVNTCECECTAPDANGTPGCLIAGYPNSPRDEEQNCANGFNSGKETRICPRICTGSGNGTTWAGNVSQGCTAWDDSTCQCLENEDPDTRTRTCAQLFGSGYTGTSEYSEKYWTCPGGPSVPGGWDSDWTVVTAAVCACDTTPDPRTISCGSSWAEDFGFGPGYEGNLTVTRQRECPDTSWSPWTIESASCSEITYSYQPITEGEEDENFVGIPVGASCSFGDSNTACYGTTGSTGVFINYSACTCAPN